VEKHDTKKLKLVYNSKQRMFISRHITGTFRKSFNLRQQKSTFLKPMLKYTCSTVAAQLCFRKNAYRCPLVVIYKMRFRHYATSRGRMAFKAKYPNCWHNFVRTKPVARF